MSRRKLFYYASLCEHPQVNATGRLTVFLYNLGLDSAGWVLHVKDSEYMHKFRTFTKKFEDIEQIHKGV